MRCPLEVTRSSSFRICSSRLSNIDPPEIRPYKKPTRFELRRIIDPFGGKGKPFAISSPHLRRILLNGHRKHSVYAGPSPPANDCGNRRTHAGTESTRHTRGSAFLTLDRVPNRTATVRK